MGVESFQLHKVFGEKNSSSLSSMASLGKIYGGPAKQSRRDRVVAGENFYRYVLTESSYDTSRHGKPGTNISEATALARSGNGVFKSMADPANDVGP